MTPRTVPIVCSRAPRHIVYVPAVRRERTFNERILDGSDEPIWTCGRCGARVKVVA